MFKLKFKKSPIFEKKFHLIFIHNKEEPLSLTSQLFVAKLNIVS